MPDLAEDKVETGKPGSFLPPFQTGHRQGSLAERI